MAKKSGQKEGHVGYSRRIPERIDKVKELNPDKCPDCGGELSSIQDIRERVVTDIEVRTINTNILFTGNIARMKENLLSFL